VIHPPSICALGLLYIYREDLRLSFRILSTWSEKPAESGGERLGAIWAVWWKGEGEERVWLKATNRMHRKRTLAVAYIFVQLHRGPIVLKDKRGDLRVGRVTGGRKCMGGSNDQISRLSGECDHSDESIGDVLNA
jgi:hypothetical protein